MLNVVLALIITDFVMMKPMKGMKDDQNMSIEILLVLCLRQKRKILRKIRICCTNFNVFSNNLASNGIDINLSIGPRFPQYAEKNFIFYTARIFSV